MPLVEYVQSCIVARYTWVLSSQRARARPGPWVGSAAAPRSRGRDMVKDETCRAISILSQRCAAGSDCDDVFLCWDPNT